MDWPRAKTILIICFFAGNLILGHQLWEDQRGTPLLVEVLKRSEDESVAVAEQLEQVGLELKEDLPTDTPRMYSLTLSRRKPEVEELRKALFASDEGEPVIIGGRLSGHQTDDAVLVIGASGAVRYQRTDLPSGMDLSPEEAKSVSNSFLSDGRLGLPGMEFDYLRRIEPNQFFAFYFQEHRDWPIYGGGITVRVQGDQVRGYQHLWYNALGYTGRARDVISASLAISANIQRISAAAGNERAAIVEVTLGYYAGMSSEQQWVADPVWRIRLENGVLVFINAYTGAIEWSL